MITYFDILEHILPSSDKPKKVSQEEKRNDTQKFADG